MKPVSFRLYPERSLYFRVNVWPTKAAMLAHCRSRHFNVCNRTQGICSTFTILRRCGKKWRTTRQLGEINLHRRACHAEVMSHEIAHAAFGWAARVGLDPLQQGKHGNVSAAEERFVTALGRMVAQFSWQAYRRGIWKRSGSL